MRMIDTPQFGRRIQHVSAPTGLRELFGSRQGKALRSATVRGTKLRGWRFWARAALLPVACIWWAITYREE